jgi:hypothetical protein
MLWSQYKLATIRRIEFLRKEITGIPNIPNQNSNFLTLHTSGFPKKIRPESLELKMESEIHLQWGPQKSEPKVGIPNQAGAAKICIGIGKTREVWRMYQSLSH